MNGRFIKFPSQVLPARVTPSILRVQEINGSPLTNAQQVAHRGNAAWKWIFEFKDLSEGERDIVQSFLLRAEGALAKFKVGDPALYDPSSYVANTFLDIFSGHGSFTTVAGSSTNVVNSWFAGASNFKHHVTDDHDVRLEWRNKVSQSNLLWRGHGTTGEVNSFEVGKTYVQRIKFFQNPLSVAVEFNFRVNSSGGMAWVQNGPGTKVHSSSCVTAPFLASDSSYEVQVVGWIQDGRVGDYWRYADYRLERCALVSNSENLFLSSNQFNSDWTLANAALSSGFGSDPIGGSASWVLFVNSTNTVHYTAQTITKPSTEDIYTTSIYAREKDFSGIRLYMDDGDTTDHAYANFDLSNGSILDTNVGGTFDRIAADIYDVGSDWYRCRVTAVVNSVNQIRGICYVLSGNSNTFAGSTSEGVEIFGGQLRKFPFMGQYVETTDAAIVGTGWQTGSKLIVDGLDPEQRIRHGARMEVVNRFYNVNSDYFERSEFKRLREETIAHREGWAIFEIEPRIRNAPVADRSDSNQSHVGETMHNPVIFDHPEMTARVIAGTVQEVEKPLRMYDVTFEVLEDLTE